MSCVFEKKKNKCSALRTAQFDNISLTIFSFSFFSFENLSRRSVKCIHVRGPQTVLLSLFLIFFGKLNKFFLWNKWIL